MLFKQQEFIPVLLGGDISNYSLARSFYEAYRTKSVIAGKHPIYPTIHTKLTEGYYDENIEDSKTFAQFMQKIDKNYPGQKKIILGNNDNYVRLIIENRKKLGENFIVPYIGEDLFNRLVIKENFYEVCEEAGLDIPKTFIFKCYPSARTSVSLPFAFPVFIKPSDTVSYARHIFAGKKKGYKAENNTELTLILNKICRSGYTGNLIIQEYIPGDDTQMHVITCYSNRKGKVKGISMGRILLQDHSPLLVGNYNAILSEYNPQLCERLARFLEYLGCVGITHFDVKLDPRDGKYKVLELNIRQGRNNYYTTASGLNLARCLVEDYLYNKELPLTIARKPCVCAIVPKYVVYIKDPRLRAKVKKSAWIRPLLMKGDYNLSRLKLHLINDLKQIINYSRYY